MFQSIEAKRPLDHVGIAVSSLEEACRLFEVLLGETSSPPEVLEAQGVRIAFVGAVELLEPLSSETPLGRFLERRGPGLHHFAYRTDDIESELARLEAQGIELIDRVPRPGALPTAGDLAGTGVVAAPGSRREAGLRYALARARSGISRPDASSSAATSQIAGCDMLGTALGCGAAFTEPVWPA